MDKIVYRTHQEAGEEGYGAETFYYSKPDKAFRDLCSEVWRKKPNDKYWSKRGRTTLVAFVPAGTSLDEMAFQAIINEFIAAYEILELADPMVRGFKSLSKTYSDRLTALPLNLDSTELTPGNEILMNLHADTKKANYSNPSAIVKGLINNSDRMGEFTVLVKNSTYIPKLAEVENLLQSCVDEAKHLTRWREGKSTYDINTVHARQDFDKALAKVKTAELKELLKLGF